VIRSLPIALAIVLAASPALAQGPSGAPATPAPAKPPATPAPPPLAGAPAPAPAPAQPAPRVINLDEALRIGLSHQPTLQQAKAATEAADARVEQARAPLLPQITGSASFQRQSQTASALAQFGTSSSISTELYALNLTGRQLLWDFGQTWGRWNASKASLSGQELAEQATSRSVALSIRSFYFNAVAAKALVGVSKDALANEQRHIQQVRAQVEVGTRPPVDLVQERVNLANAQVRLIQAENTYATARVQMEQAMGVSDLGPWEIAEENLPPVQGEDAAPEVLLKEAIASRPEIASGEAQIRAQELTVQAIQGGYGPTLGVQAGVSESGPRPSDLGTGWNAQVTLTWPLFQGGLTHGQVREARANVNSLQAQLDLQKQQVRLDVEQARLGVRAAVASLGASKDASQAAREQLTLQEGRYQTGVGSIIELSDAQTALVTALGQEVQSQFQLAVARSQLLRALGRP
jgi:outer membrane protein